LNHLPITNAFARALAKALDAAPFPGKD
jgi:hypothetical protein